MFYEIKEYIVNQPPPQAISGNITHFAERAAGELIIVTATMDNGRQYDILYSHQQDEPLIFKNDAVSQLEARKGVQFALSVHNCNIVLASLNSN
ncbi:MAG: hypothetical protein H7296_15155 [Bacteroidia bacterium]|nr:hypothetical protein [Bacteroidia bacterium]